MDKFVRGGCDLSSDGIEHRGNVNCTRARRKKLRLTLPLWHQESVGEEARVGDGLAQTSGGVLLHAAVAEQQVPEQVVGARRPTCGIISGHIKDACPHPHSISDVAIPRQDARWIRIGGIHSYEVTDIGPFQIRKIGGINPLAVGRTNEDFRRA